jgi:hypothetical protein
MKLAPGIAASGKSCRLSVYAPAPYSTGMGKILCNWTYRDVTDFLGKNGFEFYEDVGEAEILIKLQRNGEPDRFVEVKFKKGFFSSKAIQKMIRQSGIDENEWNKWAMS